MCACVRAGGHAGGWVCVHVWVGGFGGVNYIQHRCESSKVSLKYLSRSHNVFPISTSCDSAGGREAGRNGNSGS